MNYILSCNLIIWYAYKNNSFLIFNKKLWIISTALPRPKQTLQNSDFAYTEPSVVKISDSDIEAIQYFTGDTIFKDNLTVLSKVEAFLNH